MCQSNCLKFMGAMLLLVSLISCNNKPKDSDLQTFVTDHNTYTTYSPTYTSNTCRITGSGTSTHAHYEEKFTVNVGGSLGVTAGLEAAIKANIALNYGEGRETKISWDYDWPNGKRQEATLAWTWEEWKGNFTSDQGSGTFIARLPTKVDAKIVELPCLDVGGDWLTPFNDLSYNVTQNGVQYTWLIRENGATGTGTVEGETLVSILDGRRVEYVVGERDADGNPVVMYTTDPQYLGIILFRSCADFETYLAHVAEKVTPEMKDTLYNIVINLPNPTCPDISL